MSDCLPSSGRFIPTKVSPTYTKDSMTLYMGPAKATEGGSVDAGMTQVAGIAWEV